MSVQEGLGEAALMGGSGFAVPTGLEPATRHASDVVPVMADIQITTGLVEPRPLAAKVGAGPANRLVGALGVVQAALRRPSSVAVDVGLTLVAIAMVTTSALADLAAVAAFLAGGMLFGLWKARSTVQAYGTAWYLKAVVAPLGAAGGFSTALGVLSPTSAEKWVLAAFGLLAGFHLVMWLLVAFCRRRRQGLVPTLLVGQRSDTEAIARRLDVYPEMGLVVTGFCDPACDLIGGAEGQEDVERLLRTWSPTQVICVDSDTTKEIFKDLVAFGQSRIDLALAIPATRLTAGGRRLGDVGLIPVKTRPAWGSAAAKRVFDVVLAFIAVLLTSPVLLATALAIRLEDHGPVIFRQRRPGLDDEPFEIFKFRSMVAGSAPSDSYLSTIDTGCLTFKVPEDPRVTRVGRLIRRLSIDELPQLFNVLRGDMSLVGPRPLAFAPETYQGRARRRHSVRPGITGLWQVSGANALDDNDMIELDLSYVANHSLGMDLVLLLRTASAVVIRRAPV